MGSTALTAVASLIIAQGIGSAVTIVVEAFDGQAIIDFGMIALFVGISLLRRTPGAGRLALAWTILALLGVLFVGVLRLWNPAQNINVQILGVRITSVPVPEFCEALVVASLTTAVELWLLVSREVRAALAHEVDPRATTTATAPSET